MKYLITFLTIFFFSCNNSSKSSSSKIFYFDFITNDDSLKSILVQKTYSKIIYMDTLAKTFRVVPASYSTDEQYNQKKVFHISEAPKQMDNNVNKIEIKIYNNMNKDSVSYSVKKFNYQNGTWNLKSDLGNIKIPFTGYRFSTNNRFRNDIATNLISSMLNDIYLSF